MRTIRPKTSTLIYTFAIVILVVQTMLIFIEPKSFLLLLFLPIFTTVYGALMAITARLDERGL